MRCFPVAAVTLLSLCPLASCHGRDNEVAALRLELASLTGVLDTDLVAAKQKFTADFTLAADRNDMDELVRSLRTGWSEQISACDTTKSKLDALEAFAVRHQDDAEALGLAAIRSRLASKRHETENLKSTASLCLGSLRDVHATINSRGEWQKLNLAAAQGDCVIIVPTGSWTIGEFAGSCDAGGMNNPSVQNYAVDSAAPVGALLLRAGEASLGHGQVVVKIDKQVGAVEARCNDRDYLNNSGGIAVRAIAFHAP